MTIPKKFFESVKDQLKAFFPENPPEWFVKEISTLIVDRSQNELQKMGNYTDSKFESYLSKGTKLALTPKGILIFIKAIEKLAGRKKFQTSPYYQKAREAFNLIPALLAIKKATSVEYLAHIREAPDFELIPYLGLRKYSSGEFDKYEFMYISEYETRKWAKENPLPELVDFIIDKKFKKIYGKHISLIFHLALNSTNLSAIGLSETLVNLKILNPYSSIWMVAVVSPDVNKEEIGFAQLYPSYGSIIIKHKEQLNLLY
jgi:hypothetical protein